MASPPEESEHIVSFICRGLLTVRGLTHALLEDLPPEAHARPLTPGGVHPLWIAGHLAVSDEWIHGMFEPIDSVLPSGFRSLFGHDTTAIADPAPYPDLATVLTLMARTRKNLLNGVQRATPSALRRPLGDEGVGFAETPLDAVNRILWHEGWHAGQLSCLRRALGLPGIFP